MRKRNCIVRICAAAVITLVTFSVLAFAGMGNGIRVGTFTLSPGIELRTIYNSNVQRLSSGGEDDISLMLTPAVQAKQQSTTVKTQGSLWGRIERYADLTDENHEDFGESLSVSLWDRRSVLLKFDESYANIQELDYSVGKIEARGILNAGVSAGKDLTDKLQLDGGYAFDLTDYESPRLYDWSQHAVRLEVAHAMTAKSSATLTGKVGTQDSDGSDSSADFQSVLLGAKTRLTHKVEGRAGAGWYGHDSGADSISTVGYDMALAWQASPKVVVQASANNAVAPATQDRDNYRTVSILSAAGTWNMINSLSTSLTASFIQNDYDANVMLTDGSETKKKDDTVSGALRLTYAAPAKFLTAFAEVRYETKNSTIDTDDYNQTMATVGAVIAY